ncbi:hypothetical protein CAAU_2587 [Caloramator australicus RC3]|uniref:Uncharacterized protein n=1 Tax=Caloramator australicus RC3 TaxID=857293 RepID=I7LKS0_9CLOT|nr:hypothetical protein CAAU_2587 [Caloramator australicus RC3]
MLGEMSDAFSNSFGVLARLLTEKGFFYNLSSFRLSGTA